MLGKRLHIGKDVFVASLAKLLGSRLFLLVDSLTNEELLSSLFGAGLLSARDLDLGELLLELVVAVVELLLRERLSVPV